MASQQVIDKVRNLVKLASDDAAEEEEARSAAVQAIKLMKENDLTVVPTTEWSTVKATIDGMRADLAKVKQDANGKMLMGAGLGFLASKFLKV
jgi:hypothetical protein